MPSSSLISGVLLAPLTTAGPGGPSSDASVVADQAFRAWATGEQTGDYTAFRALLGPAFRSFSHPLHGRFSGEEAAQQLTALVAEREKTPNRLMFSNVETTTSEHAVLFQFDSAGQVAGGYAYQGYNVLAFEVVGGQLSGMREYFGYVDPQWFKQ